MNRRILLALVACFALSSADVNAQDLAEQIINHFPGEYDIKDGAGEPFGTVEWKVVAGGKAIAGEGSSADGVKGFHAAGWDPAKKKWIHAVFLEDGTYMVDEVHSHKDGTYHGKWRTHNPDGTVESGKSTNKVINKDYFVVTHTKKDGTKDEMHFRRK
jgi:hypothetical protein